MTGERTLRVVLNVRDDEHGFQGAVMNRPVEKVQAEARAQQAEARAEQAEQRAQQTQKELECARAAAQLGVTRVTLSNWERGMTVPRAAAVVQMASLYNVDIQIII